MADDKLRTVRDIYEDAYMYTQATILCEIYICNSICMQAQKGAILAWLSVQNSFVF